MSVTSPQTDKFGGVWVFNSWSDGGAQNHNYTVPDGYDTLSLTALFVPTYKVTFSTNPAGLSLSINGKSNWPNLTGVRRKNGAFAKCISLQNFSLRLYVP